MAPSGRQIGIHGVGTVTPDPMESQTYLTERIDVSLSYYGSAAKEQEAICPHADGDHRPGPM